MKSSAKLSQIAPLLFLPFVICPSSFASQRPPNIIHLIADDVGWDDFACYGAEKIKTPNLDRLAARGMRFTSFYAPAPLCSAMGYLAAQAERRCRERWHVAVLTKL